MTNTVATVEVQTDAQTTVHIHRVRTHIPRAYVTPVPPYTPVTHTEAHSPLLLPLPINALCKGTVVPPPHNTTSSHVNLIKPTIRCAVTQ